MKKFLVEIHPILSFSFYFPATIFHSINVFLQLLLYLYVALLPAISFLSLSGDYSEDLTFKFTVIFVISEISIYLIKAIFWEREKNIDPPGSITILIFALFSTLSSFLSTNSTNTSFLTFGDSSLRMISSVFVMSLVGFFLMLSLNVRDYKTIKRLIFSLSLGYLAVIIISLFSDPSFHQVLIIFSSIFSFLTLALLYKKFRYQLFVFSLVVFLYSISFSEFLESSNKLNFTILLFLSLLTILIQYLSLLSKNYFFTKQKIPRFKLLKSINLKKVTKESLAPNLITFMSAYILLIFVFLYLIFSSNNFFDFISKSFDNYKNYYNVVATQSKNLNLDFIKILLLGFYSQYIKLNLSLNTPFVILILSLQGLVGFVGYLVLFMYSIKTSLQSTYLSFKKNVYLALPISFFVIYIVFLNFLTFSGIYLNTLWFVMVFILTKINHLHDKPNFFEDYLCTISKTKFNKKNKFILTLKLFFVIMILMFSLTVSYQIILL